VKVFGQPPFVRYHGKGIDAYGRSEWEAKEEFLKMTGLKPEEIKVQPGEAKDWPPLAGFNEPT